MQRDSFNSSWRFHYGDPKGHEWWWMEPDPSSWRLVDLPHDWSIELPRQASNPGGVSNGFFPMGRGFYFKSITAEEAWRGKQVMLEFEGVYMNAEVWLDGHFLARHPYGYTSFMVDLTPYLQFGVKQTLKLRVDNSSQLNSRWYSGSGVYRPVWLMVANPVHLAEWGVYVTTPQVSAQSAQVRACTTLLNTSAADARVSVRSRVIAPDGSSAAAAETAGLARAGQALELTTELGLDQPLRWSVDAPQLYRLETELFAAGELVDSQATTFGVRSISFSAETGFLLNGEALKLKGGCVHHDNGLLGAASYPRSEERKVELLKASGYNAVRCAHNPPAPAFLDACDRLGMLVIDEAFDCWRDGKNPFDYHVVFDDWWQRDLDSLLLRDRNHPAIILWSIGNEVLERDRPEGAGIARMLAEHVQALDPSRPVTAAICGTWANNDWSITDGSFAALGVGGYNYLWKNYAPDHERHPQRVMAGTESFPAEALENWVAVLEHSYVIGDFVWTALDYLGESGIGRVRQAEKEGFLGEYPWHHANCGDLDICGFKRPQSYYRDILWDAPGRAPLYIAVQPAAPEGKQPAITQWGWPDVWPNWNWAGHEGELYRVEVYSACAEVELFLNGRSLGRQPAGRAERHTATFEVAYQPGELRALGFDAGQPAGEQVLATACAPAALRLSVDRSVLAAAPGDLAYITVEIVDAAGQVHPAADRVVYFALSGVGELAALGSGDPLSEELYVGRQRSTFRGRCLAVLKSIGQTGEIVLRVQADGLEPAEIRVRTG